MFFARKFKQFSDFASFQQSQIFLTKIQYFPPVWRAARRIPSIKIEIWAPIFIIRSLTLIPKTWMEKEKPTEIMNLRWKSDDNWIVKRENWIAKMSKFWNCALWLKSPKISPKNYVLLIFVNGETFAPKVCFMLLISGAKLKYFFLCQKVARFALSSLSFLKHTYQKYIFFSL